MHSTSPMLPNALAWRRRYFLAHPESVGESYLQHLRVALGFGLRMVAGGAGCLIHAFVPSAFSDFASRTVVTLHEQMAHRGTPAPAANASEIDRA